MGTDRPGATATVAAEHAAQQRAAAARAQAAAAVSARVEVRKRPTGA
jgi:hypothetical protein